MSAVKYPRVRVKLAGEDSNAFAIMARVTMALRNHGVPTEEIEKYRRESTSGDYNHLLQTAMRWVDTY